MSNASRILLATVLTSRFTGTKREAKVALCSLPVQAFTILPERETWKAMQELSECNYRIDLCSCTKMLRRQNAKSAGSVYIAELASDTTMPDEIPWLTALVRRDWIPRAYRAMLVLAALAEAFIDLATDEAAALVAYPGHDPEKVAG